MWEEFVFSDEPQRWQENWQPEIFRISNVADYFFDQARDANNKAQVFSHWTLSDFPNIAPPFKQYWMEWDWRTWWPLGDSMLRAGVLAICETIPPLPLKIIGEPDRVRPVDINGRVYDVPASTRWIVAYDFFIELRDGKLENLQRTFIPITDEGAVDPVQGGAAILEWPQNRGGASPDVLLQVVTLGVYPVLLATSFLHCRNVITDEHAPDVKLARANRRRGKRDPVTFKTLVIKPMTSKLRKAGAESVDTGLKKALHICRGHFMGFGEKYKHADGTPKGRLFGKYEGRFFVPQTLKGKSEAGVVVKDYDERVK